ncbi:hypothetical protein [Eubacterium ventriosum]|uniref:hypothetical protein n=1 Tax=Eubacterium ventriosum TaxID=39496 RepID=UPI0026741D2C|nr:hypothetical protein [Eubacterium ventriosum]
MNNSIKISKGDFCIGLYIFTICFNLIMQTLAGTNIQNILFIPKEVLYSLTPKISLLLFIIIFFINGTVSKRIMYVSLVLGIVTIIVTSITNNYALALMFMAIMTCPSGMEISTIAKWEKRSLFCLIVFTIALAVMGIIPSDVVYRENAIRNSYGFTSANAFANSTLIWMLLFGLQKKERWNWRDTIFCGSIAVAVFLFTNSRMAFIMSLVLSLFFLMLKKENRFKGKVLYQISKLCFPVLMIVCYICSWLYKGGYYISQLNILNIMMSYRLGFMRNYLRGYGIKLFGQTIKTVSYSQALRTGEAWSGLDNSYMYILICWGLIIAIILSLLYYQLGKYNYEKTNKYEAFVVIVLCIIGITENYLSLVGDNIAIIMIAIMLNKNSRIFGKMKRYS